MEDKELLELLMETDLIKYKYKNIFNLDYIHWHSLVLQDDAERWDVFRYFNNKGHMDFDLEKGVYCYKEIENDYKLIAIIFEDRIKLKENK